MPVTRIAEFDTWRPSYGGATVRIYKAGTTDLADVFLDESLSTAADNPQTLSTLTVNEISYGKFSVPLYTAQDYYLNVGSIGDTGVARVPLTALDGTDASDATVRATGGSQDIALDDVLARIVHAEDYGVIGASAATNTTTITAAIAVAAALGEGTVLLPAGTIPFTQISLSAGVVLRGQGRDATVLQSETLDKCVTITGDRAGFAALTLDGVDLGSGSIGVFAASRDQVVFDDVMVKRFETGIQLKGGRTCSWRELSIDNCATGTKLHGDTSDSGDNFQSNAWNGGVVQNCTTFGVDLSFEDALCLHTRLRIGFLDNTGTALNVNGARYTDLSGSWWRGNTTTIAVDDDDDTDNAALNTVIGLYLGACDIEDGAATLAGTCQDVIVDRCQIRDVDFTLTSPTNNILVRDCIEDGDVTISGDGHRYTRIRSILEGAATGLTSDGTATAIWNYALVPGETIYAEAKVVARQREDVQRAVYHVSVGAYRVGGDLDYQNQTANFTAGLIVTGGTSGATARIQADSDSGATGTLTLIDIVGTFEDGETITDTGSGSAEVNGTISLSNAALDSGGVTTHRTAYETVGGWNATLAVNNDKLELQVTGASGDTVEWVAKVETIQVG